MATYRTIIDVIEDHDAERSSRIAYRYLEDGENESESVTFGELVLIAQKIGAYLQHHRLRGQQVLLAIKHELAFLEALVGCFYAGAVAVPVTIPRRDRELMTFARTVESADARTIVLSRKDINLHAALKNASSNWQFVYIEDAVEFAATPMIACKPDDLAFLQYTSGSTGTSKGVQISHANLMANERAIKNAMQLGEQTIFVSWLPLFHDMGLVGSALQPLFLGVTCVLMPPQAFLMKPIRWLDAISRYRGTTSGAPNFAYDLCVDKTSDAQRATLDLSSWTVAFNGSEPVQSATLDRFAGTFATAGFKRTSFYPCYGMAESTLIVSGPTPGTDPLVKQFTAASLQLGAQSIQVDDDESAATIVACGRAVLGTEIVIVDPQACELLSAEHVGEIWIRGPSVTTGYHAAPDKTSAVFGELREDPNQRFLRTGDLGCLCDDKLFVLGRLKDIIIIRGRKYYPQDIEATATQSNTLLVHGGAAAFAVEQGRGESLAIVHELTRQGWRDADPERIRADIREAITAEHGVSPSIIACIKPGTLPRTTSGKVRRTVCRELLLADGFEQLRERALDAIAVGAIDDANTGDHITRCPELIAHDQLRDMEYESK